MWFGLGLTVAVGLVLPAPGWAQAARAKRRGAGQPGVEVEEITVTAQKREESLQETPLSVTAITGDTLHEKNVGNVIDLIQAVPNLRVNVTTGSTSSIIIGMRGLSLGDNVLTLQPPVGLYVDGAYIAHINGANLDLEDLERVEALRGPQGTLYGRNTAGGAVNLITKKPTEERSITLATEVGNYDYFKQRVTANVPLVGKNGVFGSNALGTIGLRETVTYKTRDGTIGNVGGGSSSLNDLNRIFTMTSLRWQPTKNITLDYSFEYHRYHNTGSAFQISYIYPNGPVSGGYFNLNPYLTTERADTMALNSIYSADLNTLHPIRDDGNHRMHILTGAWDLGDMGALGNLTLKSISSYRSFFVQQDQNDGGSTLHLGEFHVDQWVEHWSQELQAVGTSARLHYVGGLYYYQERGLEQNPQIFFAGASTFNSNNNVKTKSYAAYGQATWTPPILSDKLSLTAGLRFTQEQVHAERHFYCVNVQSVIGGQVVQLCNIGYPGLQDYSGVHGKAFGGFHGPGTPGLSPMADISYQWTDGLMTYFRVSRGFRSGGFNGRSNKAEAFATPFEPEKVLAYEAGFKSQWFDNRLRVNADGFYLDYTDMQVLVNRPSPTAGGLYTIENAASSEIWGAEMEASAVPVRGLELSATYSFLSPKYKEWNDQLLDGTGNAVIGPDGKPVFIDVSGSRVFGLAPENTFTLGATYTAPATNYGTFSAHIDGNWQDNAYFATTPAHASAGNYAVVNGRLNFVGIPLQKGSLDLGVFARNLFDRQYKAFATDFSPQLGWAGNIYGDPRMFGLTMAYNFTAAEAAPPPPPPVAQAAPPPPPPAKKKIVLRSVHFDFDKATLKPEAKPILDEAVQVLKHEGSVDIIVEGHTDSIGTEEYNLGLSRRRAATVRTYLVEHGVAASRITAEGMGESKPVASNDTADGRAQNRRVELHVR